MNDKEIELDDVMHEFLSELETGDSAVLAKYLEEYPEYEDELQEAAGFKRMMQTLPDIEYTPEEDALLSSRAASIVQNVLGSQAWVASHEKVANESTHGLVSLTAAIKRVGETPESFGKILRLSEILVRMIDSREVEADSIPSRVYKATAKALAIDLASLVAYVSQSPQVAVAHYKADEAPEIVKTDFQTLVERDPLMTDEDKKYWLSQERLSE